MLLAVPNISEGRDPATLAQIADAFTAAGARLLDRHEDADHHRAVYTLAAPPGALAPALAAGAAKALERIDLRTPRGHHPHVGAVDVVPVVHLEPAQRGAACAEALVVADMLGRELRLPVFLYGALGGRRTRAELRRGGLAGLAQRIERGELRPDFGPRAPHPTGGFALVAARPPLIAFNVELAAPATLEQAREIAAAIREGGPDEIPGVRAIAVHLESRGVMQVSTNVEDPREGVLAQVLDAVARHHAPAAAELVGLAPRAALHDFPETVPLRGFDPQRHVLESALN
jgi:glutamate formiminotransferase/glutamate formiminotransferase/formiminotetrahydrofolate cyclodeaminase